LKTEKRLLGELKDNLPTSKYKDHESKSVRSTNTTKRVNLRLFSVKDTLYSELLSNIESKQHKLSTNSNIFVYDSDRSVNQ